MDFLKFESIPTEVQMESPQLKSVKEFIEFIEIEIFLVSNLKGKTLYLTNGFFFFLE